MDLFRIVCMGVSSVFKRVLSNLDRLFSLPGFSKLQERRIFAARANALYFLTVPSTGPWPRLSIPERSWSPVRHHG